MLDGTDNAAFDTLMRGLCLTFNRQHSDELVGAFRHDLKHVSIGELKSRAAAYRKFGKKFPVPRDLMPEKAPGARVVALLDRVLAAKREIVGAAEQDDGDGHAWDEHEFNVTCRQAFEKILGLSEVAA